MSIQVSQSSTPTEDTLTTITTPSTPSQDTPTGPSTPSTSTEEVSGQCVTVILKRPKDQQVGTTGCKLLDSQVPGSCILEDQIPGSCISEDQIPGSCISEDQIPGSCISGDQIPDRSISEAQIPGNCISEDQIPGSSGSNRSTQDHFPGRPMTCTGMAGLEEWTDSEQPWYTFLYSPVSLEHSPPDNGVPEGGNIPGRYCEVSAQYHPPYEEEVMGTDALPSEPPGVLPTSPAISCGVLPSSPRTPPTVLSNTQAMQNPEIQHNSFYSFSTPDSVMEPPFSVKMEDRVLTGGIDMGKEGTEGGDGMTEGDGEAWVVADGGQPCVWPIKLNPWYGSQHSRCVSGEETYWLQAGWQPVGSSGMMEDSLGSPGDELIHSPSDEASTSGGKRADSKKCGVCGDRALGYNFNAITCESCKAFFRRNALKNKDFRCPFQESCKVDQVTRRFCQKCRLRKCFDIGMKKEWIMTDEEKQRKKQKIEENRARKMGDAMSDEEGVKSSNPFSPFTPVSGTESTKPQAVVMGVMRGEDDGSSKVMRVEGQTDVHSQERVVIQSTGLAVERLPVISSYTMENSNYSSDYTSSPQSEQHMTPASQCGIDHLTGGSLPHAPLEFDRFQNDGPLRTFPPGLTLINPATTISYGETKAGLAKSDQDGADHRDPRETSPHGVDAHAQEDESSPTAYLTQGSLAQVMAFNIKKEVEYPDDVQDSPQQQEQEHSIEQQQERDSWANFNIQDTLTFLQPGCKTDRNSTGLNMMDTIMNTAISAEYSAFSLLGSSNPRELNEPEKLKLSELSEANKGLMAPLCEDYNFKDLSNPSLINIINLTEIAIRRLIKMSKRVSAFKSLCQEDQIALLKGGCTELMILRSVCAYDPDKDSWKIQQDQDRFKNIKLKVLKAAPGNVYEEHKRFILAFNPEWRKDHNIIFLLSAITLFNPERPNIIHSDAIKHEQCSYLYLLKRYLECKYGGCEGRTVYHRLLERITHLHILSENHIRVFLEVNPQEVEPLLIEIFDLKQR